ENEVRSYIEDLINQREALRKRLEPLAALTELAEKTVIDANNLSQEMIKKASAQAKLEADNIRVTSEQETEEFVKQIRTEVITAAKKEAEVIKAEAQHRAKMIRESQLDGIKKEVANLAQKLQNDLVADIEGMKKNVLALSTKSSETSSNTETSDGQENINRLFKDEKEQLFNQVPWLEIEIMPPIDIDEIMHLISYLERLPEVKTADVLPDTPNPIVRVFLSKSMALAAVLRTLPQIAQVNEVLDISGVDHQSGEKRERLQLTFGNNPNKNQLLEKGLIKNSTT
ncbi:MAG: hypothetical protein WCC72_03120, partial [Dehalococcoidales bacterium]